MPAALFSCIGYHWHSPRLKPGDSWFNDHNLLPQKKQKELRNLPKRVGLGVSRPTTENLTMRISPLF